MKRAVVISIALAAAGFLLGVMADAALPGPSWIHRWGRIAPGLLLLPSLGLIAWYLLVVVCLAAAVILFELSEATSHELINKSTVFPGNVVGYLLWWSLVGGISVWLCGHLH